MSSKNNFNYKVFIVEDNKLYAQVLKRQLTDQHYRVKVFYNGRDCISRLDERPDLITLDYALPDISGHEVLKMIRKKVPEAHVIVISAQESIHTAIELLKEGATDYIVKDYDTGNRLSNVIKNIFYSDQLEKENLRLKNALKDHYNFKKLIKGNSREVEHFFDLMEKSVQTNINVSIFGEPGTGKDLVAKGIHYNSARSGKPFVTVKISAIPQNMMEIELFGQDRISDPGTGVFHNKGKIEQANEGTLFLDDIDCLDLNMQAKLLKVLHEREISRNGGSEIIPLDIRVITATRRSLANLLKNGEFRQDLYFFLIGLPIELPPLRQRGNDIILLAKYFVNEFCRENDMEVKTITDEAKKVLRSYHFPGNIRELKAIIEQACVITNGEQIKPVHLNLNIDENLTYLFSDEKSLEEYNYEIVKYFLKKYNQNVRLVSEKLSIGKSTIYRMMQTKTFANYL